MVALMLFILAIVVLVVAMVIAVYSKKEEVETCAVVIALTSALYIGGYIASGNPEIARWMNPKLTPTADVSGVSVSPDGKTVTFLSQPTEKGAQWVIETDQNKDKPITLSDRIFTSKTAFTSCKVHIIYADGRATPSVEIPIPVVPPVVTPARVPNITGIAWATDAKTIKFPQLTEVGAKWMVKTNQTPAPEAVSGNEYKSKDGSAITSCEVHIVYSDGSTSTTVNVPK